MQRVKTKKRKKQITLTETQLNKIKRDITNEVTDKTFLLLLAATADEMVLTDEQVCKLATRFERYAAYIDDHLCRMEDVRKTIEKNTGLVLRGWK